MSNDKIKIAFVCLGNICRSPMAEFIFKKLIEDKNISNKFIVDSKAVSHEEEGNPVYPPARAELEKHGITCNGKFAVTLQPSDSEKYDYFIGMDESNLTRMKRILGSSAHNKIYKLMSFTGTSADVSDPWYTNRFDVAYRDIYNGCVAFLEYLINLKIF